MKNYTKEKFCSKLSKLDWSMVTKYSNIELSWENFKTIFLKTIDTISPMKDVRLKQRSQPWFDGDILNSIRERDLALKNYQKTQKDQDFKHFKAMQNKSQNKIQKAQECYFKNKIEEDRS